jgi:LuxR family maltose regulon positive regulatory protein
MLSRFSRYFDQQKERLAALEWMALSVVALCHAGKREQGEHIIAHLLSLTEPEGYLSVYLDAGPLMKQALKVLKRIPHSDNMGVAAISMPSVTRILAAFEQSSPLVRHVEEQGHDGSSALRPNLDHPSALLEPLTTGEQRVLRLLVAGQTYAEIAKTLIVSPNTIKTWISSIYRKLNVGRRTDAIARAKQLHLLADWGTRSS